MTLRSEIEYRSVVTDLVDLRTARFSDEPLGTQVLQPPASGKGLQGQHAILVADLCAGMRLANSLRAIDGTVILAAETRLTETLIKLLSYLKELISGGIVTVYDPSSESKVQH